MSVERRFGKTLDSLGDVFGFLEQFIDQHAIAAKDAFAINLVAEELFTNMVKYSGGEDCGVLVRIGREDHQVMLELTDYDSEPFDPESLSEVDVHRSVAERKPGGLGIHIVKSMVDDLRYEVAERRLKVSVIRSLEG